MLGLDLELVAVLGPQVFPFTPSAGTREMDIFYTQIIHFVL